MNLLIAGLALAGALVADTIVTVPVRDGFDVIQAVTAGLIGATFLAVLLTFLFVLLQARSAAKAVERVRRDLVADPGVEHLRRTAANLEAISDTLRRDIGKLTGAVGGLSERIDQASARMEERIEHFNALMEVVQDEAEEAFLDSASTARGVRRGLGELGSGRAARRTSRPRTPPSAVTPATPAAPPPAAPAPSPPDRPDAPAWPRDPATPSTSEDE